ncbi:hypothetical protein MMC24_005413 [Lignoscripta atroalba]|nr:hypothetical protein [Lignoscripta atroalba]
MASQDSSFNENETIGKTIISMPTNKGQQVPQKESGARAVDAGTSASSGEGIANSCSQNDAGSKARPAGIATESQTSKTEAPHPISRSSNDGPESSEEVTLVSEQKPPVAFGPTRPEDPSVGALMQQLMGTRLETAAPPTSRLVEVSGGSPASFGDSPECVLDRIRSFKAGDKRRRELGLATASNWQRKIGFKPEELLRAGALDLPNCRPSNLSNEIHPLFDRARFDDCPDHIYDSLIPGFRLATMFLTKPACFQYLITSTFGIREDELELQRRTGRPFKRISADVPVTADHVARVNELLTSLGKKTSLHYYFLPRLSDQFAYEEKPVNCFGIVNYYFDNKHNRVGEGKPEDTIRRWRIRLHGDFFIVAKGFSRLKYPNVAQQLRFHCFFAIVICHEIMHFLEQTRHEPRPRVPTYTEPFFKNWMDTECGISWEMYTFGGHIYPVNEFVDCRHGLAFLDWPYVEPFDQECAIYYSVPMAWVENLFQMSTWERHYDLADQRQFWLPRTGTQSVHLRNTTTMHWTEEVRMAAEELAELERQAADEPAFKRRETAEGVGVDTRRGSPGLQERIRAAEERVKALERREVEMKRLQGVRPPESTRAYSRTSKRQRKVAALRRRQQQEWAEEQENRRKLREQEALEKKKAEEVAREKEAGGIWSWKKAIFSRIFGSRS